MKRISPQMGMTIEFTHEELRDLAMICGRISGSFEGPRGTSSRLYQLLIDSGIEQAETQPTQSMIFPV